MGSLPQVSQGLVKSTIVNPLNSTVKERGVETTFQHRRDRLESELG
jgi:hypothetical protein